MLAFAFRQPTPSRRPFFTAGVALLFAVVALADTIGFYRLLAGGRIVAGFPAPFSLLVFAGMAVIVWGAWTQRETVDRFDLRRVLAGGLILLTAFPLALMLFFGNTWIIAVRRTRWWFLERAFMPAEKLSDALEDRRFGPPAKSIAPGWPSDCCSPADAATAR